MTKNYWWLGVTKDIGRYVEECDMYQRMKNRTEVPVEKLKLSEMPKRLWTHLMVDFITKLPVVVEKNVILVVFDRLSKMTHFVATIEETLVEGLVKLFRDNVWKLHGSPESIVSDRELLFAVEMMKEWNKMLGIEMKLSTLYYPQIDEQTERIN